MWGDGGVYVCMCVSVCVWGGGGRDSRHRVTNKYYYGVIHEQFLGRYSVCTYLY